MLVGLDPVAGERQAVRGRVLHEPPLVGRQRVEARRDQRLQARRRVEGREVDALLRVGREDVAAVSAG